MIKALWFSVSWKIVSLDTNSLSSANFVGIVVGFLNVLLIRFVASCCLVIH